MAQGLYDKATELGEQNVRMLKKEIIEDHEYKAKAMLSLAHAYAACGDWEQAWKNANNVRPECTKDFIQHPAPSMP